MEPRSVEKTDRAEQVCRLAALLGRVYRGDDILASAFEIESLRTHVDVAPVTAQNIRKRCGHVEPLDRRLQVSLGIGLSVVNHCLGNQPAGLGVEPAQTHSTIEEGRAPGHAVEFTITYQHAAVNGPAAFELLEGHHPAVRRGGQVSPDQLTVGGPRAVHVSVG